MTDSTESLPVAQQMTEAPGHYDGDGCSFPSLGHLIVPPRPDLPLLRKILSFVDAHPEEWDQDTWLTPADATCGTTACIAGHAVLMTEGVNGENKPNSGQNFADAGQRILGLTRREAVHLFLDTDTWEEVQEAAEQIAARGGETL